MATLLLLLPAGNAVVRQHTVSGWALSVVVRSNPYYLPFRIIHLFGIWGKWEMHRTAYPKALRKRKEMIMDMDALVYQGQTFVMVMASIFQTPFSITN